MTRDLCAAKLPKGKRRWLARALRELCASDRPDWLTTVAVAVAAAFASNRRGQFTEGALLRWIELNGDELPRLVSEAAGLELPEAASEIARTALHAANEAEFWGRVNEAARVVERAWQVG